MMLCMALSLVPIWSHTWLPMGDYGGHLELMDVFGRYHSSSTCYEEVYQLPQRLGPNTLSLYATRLFFWLDTHTIGRLLLSFYLLSLPLSMVALARVLGRSPWLAFGSFLLLYNAFFNLGFLNYLLGLPLLIACFALSLGFAKNGTWPRGVGLALALVALFFAHIIPTLIALGIGAAILLLFVKQRKDLLRLTALLPVLSLIAYWSWRMFFLREATTTGRTFGREEGLALVFSPTGELLQSFHTWGMQYFRDNTDELGLTLLLLGWLLAWWPWLRKRSWRPDASLRNARGYKRFLELLRHYVLEWVLVCSVLAYFSLPSHMNEMAIITERVVILLWLFLTLLPRARFAGAERTFIAPLVLAALVYPLLIQQRFDSYEAAEVAGLEALVERLPEQPKLAYIMLEKDSEIAFRGVAWHLPKAMVSTLKGGHTDDSFAVRPYTPVQYRGQVPWPLSHYGEGCVFSPHLLDYDAILIRSYAAPRTILASSRLRLLGHRDAWWLFSINQTHAANTR